MNKNIPVTLFLAVYFLLYAVSPIAYPVHDRERAAVLTEVLGTAQTAAGPVAASATSSTEGTGGKILIKKKRALVPEDETNRLDPHSPGVLLPLPDASKSVAPVRLAASCTIRHADTGFQTLNAGHSPPLL